MNQQVGSSLFRSIVRGLAMLVVISVPAAAQNSQAESASGNTAKGKELYNRDGCYECHGRAGQGSILSGPRIGPDPIPLSALVSYIREPQGQMPPYTRKVMSDAELADIYAFLKNLPKPAEAKDIPILSTPAR